MNKENSPNFKKDIANFWTKNVPYLDMVSEKTEGKEFYGEIDNYRGRYEPYVMQLIESSAKNAGRMLELGCGLGSDLRAFARRGMHSIGVDLSFNNARLAENGFKVLGLRGEALCADAEDLPFKSDSFDLVYSFGVLHHTPNTQKAIGEVFRLLKPEGRLVIMIYHKGLAYHWIRLQYFLKKLRRDNASLDDLISEKYDDTPLSKMYSKDEARLMFDKFKNVKINIVTFGGIKANKFLWWVYYLLNVFPFLMNRLGSFIIIQGSK